MNLTLKQNLRYYFLVIITSISFFAKAQVYPVQVIPNLVPPYNITLSSYTTTTSDKINVKLLLTDINESNRQVRLKLIIKGQGLNIQSQQFVSGATSLFISGGELKTLTNFDLRPYFELNNLVGIAPQVYNRPLPDGLYQFCFEVYDYFTNQLISNPNQGCALANIIINDPPFLNLPQRGELITLKDPVNIIFQWTPRHLNATNVSYEFELREIWDNNIDPQAGFLVSPPLYQTTTFATTLLYDISKPSLLPDKTYGWRVRAISSTGISENSVFRNNGYSEIYNFKLTNSCDTPIYAMSEAISQSTVKITWQGKPEHNKYHVQYKKTDVTDAEWFEVFTYNEQAQVSNLEAGFTYDFRVGGTCNSLTQFEQSYTYTSINQFTMPAEDETAYFNCGIMPEIEITNQTPLSSIAVNESFKAGDFPIIIREVSGGNGTFTGWGYTTFPFLEEYKNVIDALNVATDGDVNIGKYTRIKVAFSGISINTDYQLIDGVVQTTYDPNWSGVVGTDEIIDAVGGAINDLIDLISGLFDTNDAVTDVYSDGVIDEDEIDILNESQESYADAIEELQSIDPRTAEQQELLDALEENNENINEVIENAGNGNNTISQNDDAFQSQEAVNNLTKVTIYFNDALQEYEIPNNSAFPTISGVPIKLNSFDKLGINDYGGLGWFVINGVKYLGCFTNSKFRGYYPKTFLDGIQGEQGKAILATKENLDAFNDAEFKGYTIANVGEQVFTIAKRVEGDEATLDCICEYNWIVEDAKATVQLPVVDRIPPTNATKSNCTGTACNTNIIAGALGSNAFDAITEAHPEIADDSDKLADLEELKNYLDGLTADKTFALYNTNELRVIGQNNLTEYRRYFKDNYIYSKDLFLEHFPESTFARDVDVIFSKVDLRKNLSENYNANSIDYLRGDKYYYAFADLTSRYTVLFGDNDPSFIGTEILSLENEGKANAVSGHNGYEQYVAKWGTDAAWMFIAQWSAVYAEDLIEGYGGNAATVKASKLFGQGVKTPSLWQRFLGIFKKSQKVKNKAQTTLANNIRARQLVDDLAENPAFQGVYDDTGFKFKLPDESGEGFVDVIEVAYDGRITIKDQSSIQNLLDEFNEIKIDFVEGSNIRVGNQSYTSGRLEVDNEGVVKFVDDATENLWTSIDEVFPVNFNGIPNATYYDVNVTYQASRPRAGVAFEQDNILELHLNIPEQLQGQGVGTEVFIKSVEDYSPSKVKGWWKESDIYTGGESVNLTIFKQKLDEGLSPIDAAFETPSGKIFKRNGFDGVPEIIKNTPEEVIIHFNPTN